MHPELTLFQASTELVTRTIGSTQATATCDVGWRLTNVENSTDEEPPFPPEKSTTGPVTPLLTKMLFFTFAMPLVIVSAFAVVAVNVLRR